MDRAEIEKLLDSLEIRQQVALLEDHDNAFLGFVFQAGSDTWNICYDSQKVIENISSKWDLPDDLALDQFESACKLWANEYGKYSPFFLKRVQP